MVIKNSEIAKLFQKIKALGLFTNSKTHDKVYKILMNDPTNSDGAKFIATIGEPKGTSECSECRKILPNSAFSYYQTRVKNDGALMRSNAICYICSRKLNAKRKAVLHEQQESIPKKPKKGDICSRCDRVWPGNWHRDHDYTTRKFRGWICGNCNMSKQDRRTPEPNP